MVIAIMQFIFQGLSMFKKSILKNSQQDEQLLASRWLNYQEFRNKIEYVRKVKEEKYQEGFLKDIFENCLGYTLDSTNPNEFNLEREKKNETDAKKADGVIILDNGYLCTKVPNATSFLIKT
jgi:hypothetical protein